MLWYARSCSSNAIYTSLVDEMGQCTMQVAGCLNFPWPLAQAFLIVPRPLRDSVYDCVASNRYKWFGKTESCQVKLLNYLWEHCSIICHRPSPCMGRVLCRLPACYIERLTSRNCS